MYIFDNLRLYTQVVDGIRFPLPTGNKQPYIITYFSENSFFIHDYPLLNIRPADVRIVVVPLSKVPRTRLTTELIKSYKDLKLYPIQSNMNIVKNKNIFYDLSQYLSTIDLMFKPSNYRQRAGLFVNSGISSSFIQYPSYKKVLIYSINISEPFDKQFVNRKIFPVIESMKKGNIPFDDMLLSVVHNSGTLYRLMVKNKEFKIDKIIQFMKSLRYTPSQEIEVDQREADVASQEIIDRVGNKVEDVNKVKVKDAIHNYLSKNPEELEKISTGKVDDNEINSIVSKSILYRVNNSSVKTNKILSNTLKKTGSTEKVLKVVNNNFSDQLLEKKKAVTTSDNIMVKQSNLPKVIENKVPTHLFNKRQIDFENNLKKDLTNSFKVLEKKELPIKVESINIVDKPLKKNEIQNSDISIVKVSLIDDIGKRHDINIEIPKIDPNSGTFRVNGKRKCLINQIILCPITFPKKYDSKFESSYSQFHIHSRRTRSKRYLDVYLGSYKNKSLLILMAYSFGFNETLKKFDITYTITDKKPRGEEYVCKIKEGKFIVFGNIKNEVQHELVVSMIKENISEYNIPYEFGTKEYFNNLITNMSGRVNTTFLITSNLENIVDPVAKQVLTLQHLPINLEDIMYYMSAKVVTGHVDDRNDLMNQRIRGSEVLVHLVQKEILGAYTTYKEHRLAGSKEPKFEINQTRILSKFINSEIVTDMEFANPLEEMATMTRVSPVGKEIGGIPDKEAIQLDARNVHPSYFGNIDPLDTPEGGNIGITQHLAVNAFVTDSRGLFHQKAIDDKEGVGILSTSCVMIPFIENNDGPRIIMAANQSRQMLPLKNPEPPIVKSGYESLLPGVLSEAFVKKAECDSKVLEVTSERIVLLCRDKKKKEVSLVPVHLKSGSGKNTLSVFMPKVKPGQSVKRGQILAEGSCIKDGEISLGRTLCAGFLPYKGYNFEDGIVISEKLVNQDLLTSLHGIEEETTISEKDRLLYVVPIGTYTKKGDPLLRKTAGELEELLGYSEEDEDIETIGQQIIKKSPGGRVVDIEVFSNADDAKFPLIKELSERTRRRYGLSKSEKFTERGKSINGILVKFKIEQELRISLGDKLANRYGAKGVISLVEKEENMPRTPWGDRLDIVLNPIGVIGRTNIGQLYELYCGLISKTLGFKMSNARSKTEIISLLKMVLPKLDGTKNKEFSTGLIKNVSALSTKQLSDMILQIRRTGFAPIIIPPFKSPSPENIMSALSILGLKPGYRLFLPEYGIKTQNEVPVGYMYVTKLEHLSELKIHSRSTGPLTGKTGQPTSGKSREGGQRLGEADTYSIMSYNCPYLLAELMGPLSDDAVSKNEILSDIVSTGHAGYRVPKISPVKDLLNSYFISLMLEG